MATVPLDDLPSSLRSQVVPEDDLPDAIRPAAKPKERTWGEAVTDVGASALGGVGSLVQLPGQVYGLLTGDFEDTGLLGAGKDISEYAQTLKSEELRAKEAQRSRRVQEASKEGQLSAFTTAIGETVTDPALLLTFLAEQAPQLLVPFGVGRAVGAGAKALGAGQKAAGTAAVSGAVGAGAVQQGSDVGAQAYKDIHDELKRKGASDQDAATGALTLARQAGASAGTISLLTQMLPGARIAERVLAGVPARAAGAGRLATAGKAALGEIVSEVPEEVGGKISSNIAMQQVKPEQDIFEGTGEAAGMAAIGAGFLGGAVGAAGKPPVAEKEPEPTIEEDIPVEPGPTPIQQTIEETVGVKEPKEQPEFLSSEEANRQRLLMLQKKVDEDAKLQAERLKREGPSNVVPELRDRSKPGLAETQLPQPTPRAELEAKQAEIDRLRYEAGLPTSKGEIKPPEAPKRPTEPKLVDNRPLTDRAAKNRLLVMQNMLMNEGGDPESLSIVPHPTAKDRFAIQSLDRPTYLQELPGTKREPGVIEMDPVDAYINVARRTNTPAARRLVQDFEAGLVTREDVMQAVEAERRANKPLPLNYTKAGEPWFLAPETYKPRGERELPLTPVSIEGPLPPGQNPPTTPPTEPPTEDEPPPPTGSTPETLAQFKFVFPINKDNKSLRDANDRGDFRAIADILAASSNPAVKRVGELARDIAGKITVRRPGNVGRGVAGVYRYNDDSIQMAKKYAGDEWTNAHEIVHALVSKSQRFPTDRQKPIVKDIVKLYDHVKLELGRKGMGWGKRFSTQVYGLANEREFVAEAMSNPDFQYLLMQIPYKGKKSAWTEFVRIVADLLGISNTNALTEVMNLTDKLAKTGRPKVTPYDSKDVDYVESAPESDLLEVEEDKVVTLPPKESPKRETTGQQALNILKQTGTEVKAPELTAREKAKLKLREAMDNPKLAAKESKAALQKWFDWFETASFSADAAFNNDIRRALIDDFKDNPEVLGMLIEASQSQVVHADALSTQFIVEGGIAYDNEARKWVAIKKEDNFIKLAQELEKLAKKHGLTKEESERVAHTYFIAQRFNAELNKQTGRETMMGQLEEEINKEKDPVRRKGLRADLEKIKKSQVFISDEQKAMIQPGLSLANLMPELKEISATWQGIRVNAIKAMIDGGLWSLDDAIRMLENAEYVPFYREEQLEQGNGPKEFIKGLQVKADEYRLKGSASDVNDIFDNMVRWTQYAINRSVRNHKALQMVNLGTELQVGDGKMMEKVEKMGDNVIRVFRDGDQELYKVADPLYMNAFMPIENVAIPSLRFFSWMSNLLRQSVVMYPLFSVAQVPQDAISAIFTSGLKPQYAFRIPVLAVKEFIKTLRKTSATHETLKKYGATGVRDFSASVARQDVEIASGLKAPKDLKGKIAESLSHFAMAADNAVRQAVYDASMQQGLSKAEAIEKAFDIINFRRRGTSKLVNFLGQTVPFFYAYMSVQRVALKTLSGVGISPTTRKEALSTLAYTTAAMMALSLIYTMANAGDDEYEKTPVAIRDRTLHVPGTTLRIPLRPDFFLFPKVITEHMYHLITENGYSDPAKFRKTLADGLVNAIASPQPIPQAAKPVLEVAINYDFFQGRPIVGPFESKKEAERQFNDNTSELSKVLGSSINVSPIKLDHLFRGMFGSVGGLTLYATNVAASPFLDVPRPDKSFQDALASIPGTSGFVTKSTESRLKNDFYELRDEVERANETFKDIRNRSPEQLEAFLADERNIVKLGLAKTTDKITRELSKIRKAISQVSNAPEDLFTAQEKKVKIKELRDIENQILESINVPEMRKKVM